MAQRFRNHPDALASLMQLRCKGLTNTGSWPRFAHWQGTAYTLVALNVSDREQWAPFWFPISGTYTEQLHGGGDPGLNLTGIASLQETWLQVPPDVGRVWCIG